MTRIERLDPALKHADEKEQVALKQLAAAQNEVDLEQKKLKQLREYRDEYIHRRDQVQTPRSAIELQEFNRFLNQLDETIKKQVDVTNLRQRQLEQQRAHWLKAQVNTKVINQVIENLHREEMVKETRSEQKLMDEFTLRKLQGR